LRQSDQQDQLRRLRPVNLRRKFQLHLQAQLAQLHPVNLVNPAPL
jgi:hypothetical protein